MPRPKLEDKILQLGQEVVDWKTIIAQLREDPMGAEPRRSIAQKRNLLPTAYYNTSKAFLDDITSIKEDASTKDLITYIQSNVDIVLNKYEDKNLFYYMAGSMSPVANKDDEHNKLAHIHDKFLKVQSYKTNNAAKIDFIVSELGDKDLAETDRMVAEADPFFKEIAFKSREVYYTAEFEKAFHKKNGKLDSDKINKYVKDTYTASSEKGKKMIAYGLGMKLYEQFAKK